MNFFQTLRFLLQREGELLCKSNLTITARERGKIVGRRKGHNIFLDLGRAWLPDVIAYSSLPGGSPPPATPVTKVDERGVRYMGLGIGGTRQNLTGVVGAAPYSTHYPGSLLQSDADPGVQRLERPVRLTAANPGSPALPPYDAADVWLGQVQSPAVKPTPSSVRFTRVFSNNEISFGPFLSVPLSEVLLVLHSTNPSFVNAHNNTGVAYDTFDPFQKTLNVAFQFDWDLRF